MAELTTDLTAPSTDALDAMHELYRSGGEERQMAPHIVYDEAECPHPGCDRHLRAIDFRLEDHGRDVHDPLVRSWWRDTGFAGKCPGCGDWILFTIRSKTAITPEEAGQYPQLPENWHQNATIL